MCQVVRVSGVDISGAHSIGSEKCSFKFAFLLDLVGGGLDIIGVDTEVQEGAGTQATATEPIVVDGTFLNQATLVGP